MKNKVVVFIIAVLFFTGCTSNQPFKILDDKPAEITAASGFEPENNAGNKLMINSGSYEGQIIETDDGAFVLENIFSEGKSHYLVSFVDYNTRKQFAVCSAKGCKHDNDKCPAYLDNTYGYVSMGYVNNNIVIVNNGSYFAEEEEAGHAAGIDILDIKGKSRKNLLKLEKGEEILWNYAIYDNNSIYFTKSIYANIPVAESVESPPADEVAFESPIANTKYLMKADIATGELTELFNMEESEFIIGAYEDSIYTQNYEQKRDKEQLKKMDEMDKALTEAYSSGNNEEIEIMEKQVSDYYTELYNKDITKLFSYNVSTNKKELVTQWTQKDFGNSVVLNKQFLYYCSPDFSMHQLDIITKKEKTIGKFDFGDSSFYYLSFVKDNNVFIRIDKDETDNYKSYMYAMDIDTGEAKEITLKPQIFRNDVRVLGYSGASASGLPFVGCAIPITKLNETPAYGPYENEPIQILAESDEYFMLLGAIDYYENYKNNYFKENAKTYAIISKKDFWNNKPNYIKIDTLKLL